MPSIHLNPNPSISMPYKTERVSSLSQSRSDFQINKLTIPPTPFCCCFFGFSNFVITYWSSRLVTPHPDSLILPRPSLNLDSTQDNINTYTRCQELHLPSQSSPMRCAGSIPAPKLLVHQHFLNLPVHPDTYPATPRPWKKNAKSVNSTRPATRPK